MASNEALPAVTLTPEEGAVPPAIEAASHSLIRRVVETPIQLGRDVLKIVMNGDMGEMLSSSSSHLN